MMSKEKAPIAHPTLKRRLNRIKVSNQLFIKLETMFKLIDFGPRKSQCPLNVRARSSSSKKRRFDHL